MRKEIKTIEDINEFMDAYNNGDNSTEFTFDIKDFENTNIADEDMDIFYEFMNIILNNYFNKAA